MSAGRHLWAPHKRKLLIAGQWFSRDSEVQLSQPVPILAHEYSTGTHVLHIRCGAIWERSLDLRIAEKSQCPDAEWDA